MSTDEELLKEAKNLPWEDRLLHNNWKVRNDANIDLASFFQSISDPKDPRLLEFGHFFMKTTVADSNAIVQDKALDALIAYLKAVDADVGRFANEVCHAIVEKCLTGSPKTVEKSQAVLMLWIEVGAADAFLEAMEKAIKKKVAKAVVPAVNVMFQALSEFGAMVVPPKRILKMLPELLHHRDQNVRTSSKELTYELCRWIGKDSIKSILFEKMRDTMKKQLEAKLVNVAGTAKPTRKIRSELGKDSEPEAVTKTTGDGSAEEFSSDASLEVDEYELVDPVDILTPLEKSGFWDGVKATKWSERKEGVAELTRLASTKKIKPGDFTEVCRILKKLVTDVSVAVSVEAIQAIGNLACGLRAHFSGSSRFLLPVLLEKLKEKKPTLSDALSRTLQVMYKSGCINLVDIVEDIKTAVKNKVPLVRSLTLTWLTFCLETSNKTVIQNVHKDYVPICIKCLQDGTPEVRDAAFSALTAIAKSFGMGPLERSLAKLDNVQRKKLNDMIGSSGSGPVVGGSSVIVQTSTGAVSQPSNKKATSATPATTKKGEGLGLQKVMKKTKPGDIEPLEMSVEENESTIRSLIQRKTICQLEITDLKERLEAISLLKEQVKGIKELDKSVEFLIRLLRAIPGWSDRNLQSVEGMKVVCHEVAQAMNDPQGSAMNHIVKDADWTDSVLANKAAQAFGFSVVGASFRSFKYVLNILKQIIQSKTLVLALEETTLDILVTELMLCLLDERVPRMVERDHLLKALNALLLKILDSADQTSSFVVLINLLRPLDPLRLAPASCEVKSVRSKKFSELVLNCLIYWSQVLQSTIDDLELDRILEVIHLYLQGLDMIKIMRRDEGYDRPLLMVNSIIHDLAKLRGTAIKDHLSMVPIDKEPQPIILACINYHLQTLAEKTLCTSNRSVGQTHLGDSKANNSSSATHFGDGQLKQELAAIFARANYVRPGIHIDWNDAFDFIANGSPEQSLEGMRVVCHEVAQSNNDPEGKVMNGILKDVDQLVSILANKVATFSDFNLTESSSRFCKCVFNTLMQICQSKTLAHALQEITLDMLITVVLRWLLDEFVPYMAEVDQLLNTLKALMLKILDNANQTSSFVVLINLLRPLDPSRLAPASSEAISVRSQKFSDLVVECLIILTKGLKSSISDVDLDLILKSIHAYLQDLGMEVIGRRNDADDKPILMVKTVLHELVKLRGAAIKNHLSMVPIDTKPQPIILSYINLNLQNRRKAAPTVLSSGIFQDPTLLSSGINNLSDPDSSQASSSSTFNNPP